MVSINTTIPNVIDQIRKALTVSFYTYYLKYGIHNNKILYFLQYYIKMFVVLVETIRELTAGAAPERYQK